MSNNVFPSSLPGIDIEVERSTSYATTVQTSSSGKEQRASWQSTPRYTYRLRINFMRSAVAAPSPYQALNELTVIQGFIDDHKGQWDSFLFNDPVDGVQRRVRFTSDELTISRLVNNIWTAEIEMITVK